MRQIGLSLVLASMVVAIGCNGDRALAPKTGHLGQIADIPPELIADYTRVSLPGTETVVALNDSGDVVGATKTGGVLWHGAAHERTTLPIIPTAIANDGTVAGSIDGHAATWKDGRVTVLDTATSAAKAICRCESATLVGSVKVNGETHAALWVDGIRIDAGVPPNGDSAVFSAIATGFVVGNATVPAIAPGGVLRPLPEPFSWSRAILYDVAAGIGDDSPPSHHPFDNVFPTGINDSDQISANADFIPDNGTGGPIALVNGQVLPPGVFGDRTAGINTAGIVGGQSNGLPVLWVPNP